MTGHTAPSASHHPGPGRPRGFDRDAAVDAGVALFRRRGFEATSLEDLTETMGISRSSFYAAFGSKRGVLLAALDRYSRRQLGTLREAAAGSNPAAILRMLSGADGDAHGCLLVNCVSELCPADPEVASLAARHLERIEAIVGTAIGDAEAASVLVAVALGAQTLRKSGAGPETVEALLARAAARLGFG